jgi:hypothetical protein
MAAIGHLRISFVARSRITEKDGKSKGGETQYVQFTGKSRGFYPAAAVLV